MILEELPKLILPALRGIMGDWVYYSCLMNLKELNSRVHYAKEIHKSESLSEMIQRDLDEKRSKDIAEYLETQEQRFLNSLVVAVYGGQPNWFALSEVRNSRDITELQDISPEIIESVGFLILRGDEKLFVLDGQHRLAGIKKIIGEGLEQDPFDEVSVLFVGHESSDEGLRRTRRLFTTINKTATPVSKSAIIALDEDDVMAICVRRLIEESSLFGADRIAYVAHNNMPTANKTSLTTIGNLYDVLTILFTKARSGLTKAKAELQKNRPSDEVLDLYFEFSRSYFSFLLMHFEELEEYHGAASTGIVVEKYRGTHGGKALFRPIGLEVFTLIVARLTIDMSIDQAVKLVSVLPRDLSSAPYAGVMWDPKRRTILNKQKALLRELLCYMIGKNGTNYPEQVLLEKYRIATGDEFASLPPKLV